MNTLTNTQTALDICRAADVNPANINARPHGVTMRFTETPNRLIDMFELRAAHDCWYGDINGVAVLVHDRDASFDAHAATALEVAR